MIPSTLMSIMTWLLKTFSTSAVHAVSLALNGLIKLIQAVPPDEYAKLAAAFQAFLQTLVAKLPASHPAIKALSDFKKPQ